MTHTGPIPPIVTEPRRTVHHKPSAPTSLRAGELQTLKQIKWATWLIAAICLFWTSVAIYQYVQLQNEFKQLQEWNRESENNLFGPSFKMPKGPFD